MEHFMEENREYWLNDDGQLHGEYKWWYDNGQFYVHCFYAKHKLHGEYTEWYPNGELWIHCFYVDGGIHGEYKAWYDNGELWMHCFYEHDKEVRDFIKDPFTCDEEKFEFALMYEGRWLCD